VSKRRWWSASILLETAPGGSGRKPVATDSTTCVRERRQCVRLRLRFVQGHQRRAPPMSRGRSKRRNRENQRRCLQLPFLGSRGEKAEIACVSTLRLAWFKSRAAGTGEEKLAGNSETHSRKTHAIENNRHRSCSEDNRTGAVEHQSQAEQMRCAGGQRLRAASSSCHARMGSVLIRHRLHHRRGVSWPFLRLILE